MSASSPLKRGRGARLRTLLTAWLIVGLASIAAAQEAAVIGTVADATKALLPGATVTATSSETGRQVTTVSDGQGAYRLAQLPPGRYRVQADLPGFSSVIFEQVELLVGQTATLPFTLSVASLNETLVVRAESPLVNTASSQISGNVDRRQMEQLPLQGRNWMELSKLVKGVTANEIGNSIGTTSQDDLWQLSLDGQQITQKVANSGFGQPRFSREAIAEFQIVTNLFDVTQGRSSGMSIQAISKSGTNINAGSAYGYFRDDALNAPDKVAARVLPYSNQQIGATFGGPIVRDRTHYFASYEYEREPGTLFSSPSALPTQSFTIPYQNGQKSFLTRVDDQLSSRDRISVRGSYWTWANPAVLSAGAHPSTGSSQTKQATSVLGTWTRTFAGGNRLLDVKGGYNGFDWDNSPLASLTGTPEYRIPGLTVGPPSNYPQNLMQDTWNARGDFTWHRSGHDIKIGAEYLFVRNSGPWYIQRAGFFTFQSAPPNLAAIFPQDAALDASQWNIPALNAFATTANINFTQGDWNIDVPRPTYAVWLGDNWRVADNLTLNLGIRYDADPNVASPPDIVTSEILINSGIPASVGHQLAGTNDYGYKSGIRDWSNVAPRAGFSYNVGGNNDFVIRGGSGLYFASPVSNVTFSPQLYSQLVSAQFVNDGRADFITNPTNGLTAADILSGQIKLPTQTVRSIAGDFRSPFTWQSSIGFQKQLGAVTGIDVDLTHFTGYRDTRTIDANLQFDPVTGYNKASGAVAVRPNPNYGPVYQFVSDGRRRQTALASSINRRLQHRVQAGATFTVMLDMKDNGGIGYGSSPANNPFDYLDGEWATSQDFQRSTVRTWALVTLPYGINVSTSYFYGSGNRFAASIATTPYGKTGTNRLNLTGTGGASPAITVPAAVLDRWNGPAVIDSGAVIPRNALAGLALHKVDLHVAKQIGLGGTVKAQLTAEVFNLFNHANYGSYNTALSPTNAATTALFGTPQQNTGNAYVSRQGQLSVRVSF